jgi:xanthine/CO dehydrogenase XdhC/CoxF family maturation factor
MPLGIPIGSVTPEEIAVSIAAQLIQFRHERLGCSPGSCAA